MIGSLESRSAARMRLVRLKESRKRIRFIHNISGSGEDRAHVCFGDWQECQNGALFQMVYVPHVWLKPEEPIPVCPDCGTPFKKTGEYPNLVGFTANCIDKHDPELSGQAITLPR